MMQNENLLTKFDLGKADSKPRQVCCMIRAREPCFGVVSVPALRSPATPQPVFIRPAKASRKFTPFKIMPVEMLALVGYQYEFE